MSQSYRFDRFEVRTAERALLIDGARAELGSRAFDVLQALIKHRDRVVTKDELLDMVWPGLVVEENNLQAQVSALRKLLGPKAIATIPGRGYQFSLSETVLPEISAAAMPSVVAPMPHLSQQPSLRSERRQVLVKAAPQTLTDAERAAVLGGQPQVTATNVSALSIAVLPFTNLTGDANDEYFADGLAEELLNVLAKIKGLRVAARTSAFSFKNKSATVAEIGRQLNVATVLEGSVRKSGSHVRISVQLVKVEDGFHLWSETYDRTLDDIFAVQDNIAQFVLAELRTKLVNQTDGRIEMHRVESEVAVAAKGRSGSSGEAHRLYLYAKFLMYRGASADILKCIDYLRQALAIDPDYAQAWAALSVALVTAADVGASPVGEGVTESPMAAKRALLLAPEVVDGHVAMANYQWLCAWDWQGAMFSVQRALTLAPNDSGALEQAASVCFVLGRFEEALEYAERATTQDPLNAACFQSLGRCFSALERWGEAEKAIHKALELSPDAPVLHAALAAILERQGRYDEAFVEANRETANWSRWRALSVLHFRLGNIAEADRTLNALVEHHGHETQFNIASLYAMRGDADRAFEWLERAYTVRDSGLSYLKIVPLFRPIQSDPRWPVFLKKMGFDD